MYEIIVRVARAIACLPRLRILSCVAGTDEVMPTDLARELGMSRDLVATHLRRLSAAALIQRRRSGARSYCIASSPYAEDTISGRTVAWLRQMLEDPARAIENSEVEQVRNCILRRTGADLAIRASSALPHVYAWTEGGRKRQAVRFSTSVSVRQFWQACACAFRVHDSRVFQKSGRFLSSSAIRPKSWRLPAALRGGAGARTSATSESASLSIGTPNAYGSSPAQPAARALPAREREVLHPIHVHVRYDRTYGGRPCHQNAQSENGSAPRQRPRSPRRRWSA